MSILKRTIFYDDTGGFVRFRDWARVTTTLGAMMEPHVVNLRQVPGIDFANFDPEDEIARVDLVQRIDAVKENTIFSWDSPVPLHGGIQMPRVGK
jgi:hypothetical protein